MKVRPRAVFAVLAVAAGVSALATLALIVAQPAAVATCVVTAAVVGAALGARYAASRNSEPAFSPAETTGTLAIHDAATGLHAEWYVRLRAHSELRRAGRHRYPLSVVSLWCADDARFRRLAETLRTRLRAGDLAAPFGNLQIVCLLPGTSAIGAMGMVARTLAEAGVHAQVGIAQTHDPDDTLGDLLEKARRGRTSFGPATPRLSLIRTGDGGAETSPTG